MVSLLKRISNNTNPDKKSFLLISFQFIVMFNTIYKKKKFLEANKKKKLKNFFLEEPIL